MDNRTRANQSPFSYRYSRYNRGVTAQARADLNSRLDYFPVCFGLQRTICTDSAGINIVCEHHAVTNKNLISYFNTLTNESV